MIYNSSSGVADGNFCLTKELLDVLKEILTLNIFALDKYCYLLNYNISLRKYLDFFLKSDSSSLPFVAFSLTKSLIKVFINLSGLIF